MSLLVDIVDDFAGRGVDEVNAVIRVDILVPAHGRTPIRRNGAQLDIIREPAADRNPLRYGSPRHLLLDHVFLNACALLRIDLDFDALSERLAGQYERDGRGAYEDKTLHVSGLPWADCPVGRTRSSDAGSDGTLKWAACAR